MFIDNVIKIDRTHGWTPHCIATGRGYESAGDHAVGLQVMTAALWLSDCRVKSNCAIGKMNSGVRVELK